MTLEDKNLKPEEVVEDEEQYNEEEDDDFDPNGKSRIKITNTTFACSRNTN